LAHPDLVSIVYEFINKQDELFILVAVRPKVSYDLIFVKMHRLRKHKN